MHLRPISLLFVVLLTPALVTPASAQEGRVTLAGQVVDAQTGRPLTGVNVFIAGSLVGTATDGDGCYRIDRVRPGGHTLYVSMMGYEADRRDSLFVGGRTYRIDFALEPAVVEMGGVTVEAERDAKWRKRLERFEKLFIGESDNAAETTITNPEVLDFDGTWWGKLTATATAPLVIENEALGYRIRYFLNEFEAAGGTIRYDGEPLFEEMTPAGPEQQARWEANREKAYRGSFRHFMMALLNDDTADQGFKTYHRLDIDNPYAPSLRFPYRATRALQPGDGPDERVLRFPGFIEIVYQDEQEDDAFMRWQFGVGDWPARGPQRSWIELNDGPTVVDRYGEVLDPYGVTVYGYFAFERVADQVPKEYRPFIR